MSAGVVPVRSSDGERLSRFFARVEPGFSVDTASAEWRWRMEANPFNPGGKVQAWLFELSAGGEVAGYLGTIPVVLEVGGRRLRAAWSIDLVVLPEYRARGITPFLYKPWLAGVDVALALGTTRDSYTYLTKSGWRRVGSVSRFRRVLRLEPYAGTLMGKLAAPFLKPRQPLQDEVISGCSWDAELDGLWDRSAPGMGVAVRRDLAYAAWRYRDRPGATYDFLTLKSGKDDGRVEGMAVLRERREGNKRIGVLVDLWAAPGRLGDLVGHGVAALARRGVDVVHADATHASLAAALRSACFRPRPTSIQCLYFLREGLDVPAERFADLGGWWVTLGDSDQDRG